MELSGTQRTPRSHHPNFVWMESARGSNQEQTGQITLTDLVTYEDYSKEPEYCMRFQDGQYWWLESWIKPNTEYKAF